METSMFSMGHTHTPWYLAIGSCLQYRVLRLLGSRNSPEPVASWTLHKSYDIPMPWQITLPLESNDHTHTETILDLKKILIAHVIVPLFCARMSTVLEHNSDHCLQSWHNWNHPSLTPIVCKSPATSSRHLFLTPWNGHLHNSSLNKSCLGVWPSSMNPSDPIIIVSYSKGNQQLSGACQIKLTINCAVAICSFQCGYLVTPKMVRTQWLWKVVSISLQGPSNVHVSAPYNKMEMTAAV